MYAKDKKIIQYFNTMPALAHIIKVKYSFIYIMCVAILPFCCKGLW